MEDEPARGPTVAGLIRAVLTAAALAALPGCGDGIDSHYFWPLQP
jgi:hypothetical protein